LAAVLVEERLELGTRRSYLPSPTPSRASPT